MKAVTQDHLPIVSKLFSSAVFQELARKGYSPSFSLIARSLGLGSGSASDRVRDAFDDAFDCLRREGSRDEYIYKSALVRKILLGRHSLKTACILNEFRVHDCKADVAILNGTSTVYEIKSERDSLTRLHRQLVAYSKVFARVYVVTAETHLGAIIDAVPAHVGVMRVNNRFQISVMREAVDQSDRLSVDTIFESLRMHEARRVLSHLGVSIPDVPNTELGALLREKFAQLTSRQAHDAMVAVLKNTRSQQRLSDLIARLPVSLHAAALSVPIRKIDHARLVTAVNTELSRALSWG